MHCGELLVVPEQSVNCEVKFGREVLLDFFDLVTSSSGEANHEFAVGRHNNHKQIREQTIQI
jgi:hypothetical protein